MKASEGKIGRVYILHLEDGDSIPSTIENFAEENNIRIAQVILLGGIGYGQVVTGPRYTDKMPPDPLILPVDGAHEAVGVGLLAPGENGKPVLHIHAALGRAGQTLTGCLRQGVETWLVGEVILYELVGLNVKRAIDSKSGFELLKVE